MAKRREQPELKPAGVVEGDVVGPVLTQDEDEQMVASAMPAVMAFFRSLAGFFTTAKALEEEALATEQEMNRRQLPASAEEDEQLQRAIVKTSTDKKAIEAHWSITATISGFHRRLTARRSKATDALERANKRGNELHNTYVSNAKRAAEAEQRRLQAEADERERQAKERELQALEDAAVARETASPDLSAREQIFVEQMALHGDGVRAARDAGFKTPAQASSRLLQLEKITKAVQALQEAAAIRRQQEALKRQPIIAPPAPTVAPKVVKATGTQSRSYHYGDVVDEQRLIDAVLAGVRDGTNAIPSDILCVNQSKVHDYAKQLEGRIALWPGVNYRKDTKVV